MIYIASPYTAYENSRKSQVEEKRYDQACKVVADLMRHGWRVFSPIVHCHPLKKYGLPGNFKYWQEYNREMIKKCDQFWVLKLNGWGQSEGVTAEIDIADKLKKEIKFIDSDGNI